jgi:hypothetical protein
VERIVVPKEIVSIPRSELAGYEYGARVYGVLAYPDDPKARERFDDALCYLAIQTSADADPSFKYTYKLIRPHHLLQDPHVVDREYEEGSRMIADRRLIAAKMAAPTVAEAQAAEMGAAFAGPAPKPFSLDVLTAVDLDLDDRPRRGKSKSKPSTLSSGNIAHRHWKPSRPVLHLSIALHDMLHRINSPSTMGIVTTLFMPGFIDELLATADRMTRHLGNFEIGDDEWVKIEIT